MAAAGGGRARGPAEGPRRALVTGASRGIGRALADGPAERPRGSGSTATRRTRCKT
jgi:NAD(P)-dependent dehydrogenase (short-subunit alcohol dehydrogenase family)